MTTVARVNPSGINHGKIHQHLNGNLILTQGTFMDFQWPYLHYRREHSFILRQTNTTMDNPQVDASCLVLTKIAAYRIAAYRMAITW